MNMGKMTSVARPYAIAAFEFALSQDEKDVEQWEKMLEIASLVVEDASTQQLLSNPQVTSSQLEILFCDVLKNYLDTGRKNFLRLLAENRRLNALPEITALFKSYFQARKKIVTVNVTSATPLTHQYQQHLSDVLTKKLHQKVLLSCTVNPSLIGGVIVQAGDRVMDGSIRNKLNRLNEFITDIS